MKIIIINKPFLLTVKALSNELMKHYCSIAIIIHANYQFTFNDTLYRRLETSPNELNYFQKRISLSLDKNHILSSASKSHEGIVHWLRQILERFFEVFFCTYFAGICVSNRENLKTVINTKK